MPRKAKNGSKNTLQGKKGGVAMQQQPQVKIHPMIGAAVGAAVGSVVGAAAAVVLSDKDTRGKMREVALNLKDQAANRMHEMTTTGKDIASDLKKAAPEKSSAEARKKSE